MMHMLISSRLSCLACLCRTPTLLLDDVSSAEVLVRRSRGCETLAVGRDEVAGPQAAKGLVADDGRAGIEIGHDFLEIGPALSVGGAPEPEL